MKTSFITLHFPKNEGNFKTFITSEIIQKSIIYKTPIQYPNS